MSLYQGIVYGPAGPLVVIVDGRPLDPRHDLRNHSPDGFNWGYTGSGPAQLALAILADAKGDDYALTHYQAFKFEVIARLPSWRPWQINSDQIEEWCRQHSSKL